MKKASYAANTHLLPVKSRDAVDIDTGEVRRISLPAHTWQPDFGYFFLDGFLRTLTDARLTGNALKVFCILFLSLPFDSNMAHGTTTSFQQKLHIGRQEWHKAIELLRTIGAVLPSQEYGKYHLNMDVVYRGHLRVRKRLLRGQEVSQT